MHLCVRCLFLCQWRNAVPEKKAFCLSPCTCAVVTRGRRESKCVQVSEWILASSSLLLLSAACTFAMYSYMGGML